MHRETFRHRLRRWAAGLALSALLLAPACWRNGSVRMVDPESGEMTRIELTAAMLTTQEIQGLRNSIFVLNRILQTLVSDASGFLRTLSGSGDERVEKLEGWLRLAGIPREVAEEYFARCDAVLTRQALTPRENTYLQNRYRFAYDLLSDAIRRYSETIAMNGSVQRTIRGLGYELDLDDL